MIGGFAMTRPRNASTLALARVALSLVALASAGCSFSFKSGSGTSNQAGRPAIRDGEEPRATKPTTKPIAKADPEAPADPAEPAVTEPDQGPTRTPPAQDPPPVVEPKLTAVCRTQDSTLEALCHRALDPIAADDLDAWVGQLDEQVVVTRPTYRRGMQRVEGPQRVRGLADRAGGLRALLHLRPTDRIVGTVANDCRQCRRAVVVFEANTRSGTITVELEMTQPPQIVVVDVGAHMRRRPLEELEKKPKPTDDRPTIVPPEQPDPAEPGGDVAPPKKPVPTDEKPVIVPPEPKADPEAKPNEIVPPKKKPAKKDQPTLVAPKQPQ